MNCPIDNTELEKKPYEVIETDFCPKCEGMFLQKGELERAEESRKNNYSDEVKAQPDVIAGAYEMAKQESRPLIKCPNCFNEMERREYGYTSQIMIDDCPNCGGIWLNKNELRDLEIFFERARRGA
jgi:Zn-finger nucleic acid-binding protein